MDLAITHRKQGRAGTTFSSHKHTANTLRVVNQFQDRVANERASVSGMGTPTESSPTSQRGVEVSTSQPGKRHVLKDDLAHVVRIPFKSSSRAVVNKPEGDHKNESPPQVADTAAVSTNVP